MAEDLVSISILNNNSGRVAARLENVVEKNIKKIATQIENRIRKKFEKSSWRGPSNPGEYPRRINGHAANSITVRKIDGQNVIRAGYVSQMPRRYKMRIRHLEEDKEIAPKSKKRLAIPLTWQAKQFSSNNTGAKSVKDFRPGGKDMEVIFRNGHVFLGVKTSLFRRVATGKRDILHFILLKKAVTRRSRKSLYHAFMEEEKWFVKKLTNGIESGFGAP